MKKSRQSPFAQIPKKPPAPRKNHTEYNDINFAQAVGSIIPLKADNRYIPPPEKPPLKKRFRVDVTQEYDIPLFFNRYILDEDINSICPPAQHFKNGRGKQDINKLLHNHYPIVATLDLHGHTRTGLEQTLSEFCFHVRQYGVCARIIHGSGLGSYGGKSVLKKLVRFWLIDHPDVLAYTEENQNDGSILVLFKRNLDKMGY